jgi:hypothetical protein
MLLDIPKEPSPGSITKLVDTTSSASDSADGNSSAYTSVSYSAVEGAANDDHTD